MKISTKQYLAIKHINPDAEFSIMEDNLDTIQFLNGTAVISKADIEAKFPTVELDYALNNLREKRNTLLIETDYMANSDVTMSDEWKTYRQALRDLTSGLDTVKKVEAKNFPTKPS
tara:strand:- start:48 stop:395 length:348 start_codon:yes stop_codon:yes gene_type:complete